MPLSVLWQPGVLPDVLGARGVGRISTGSSLYRHGLIGARRATTDAASGEQPAAAAILYDAVRRLLFPSG